MVPKVACSNRVRQVVLKLFRHMVVLFDMSHVCLFVASSKKKIVYIDSPLLKTEMTFRERSHIFHEESLKLSIIKNGSVNIFHVMTERPINEQQVALV